MPHVKVKKVQIYGITGKKGSGKDSFAKLVQDYNPNFTILRFADDLKWMTHKIFNFPLAYMESQEEKARKLKTPIEMDLYLPEMIQYTGLPLQKNNIIAYTLREILQYFGTEYVRAVCDGYWVNRVLDKIKRIKNKVLIPDCRFENEVSALKSIGGKIIKINRIDSLNDSDSHKSEQEIDLIKADLTLGTLTGKFTLQKRVAYLMALNKNQSIWKFDYNKVMPVLEYYTIGGTIKQCAIKLGVHNHESKAFYSIMDYYGVKPRTKHFEPHKFENGIEVKKCGKCKKFLSLDNFGMSSRAWDMLNSYCAGCRTNYSALYKADTLYKIWKNSQKNAKARGIVFDLTFEDVSKMYENQNKKCYYSGVEMTTEIKSPKKITIDRLVSSAGYSKLNTVLCSYSANIMKNKMSISEFSKWIKLISGNISNWGCSEVHLK